MTYRIYRETASTGTREWGVRQDEALAVVQGQPHPGGIVGYSDVDEAGARRSLNGNLDHLGVQH